MMRFLAVPVIAILLFALPSLAQRGKEVKCNAWWVCPYVTDPSDPKTRYLSLVDKDYGFRWHEIEVSGNQALVCVPRRADIKGSGCMEINRREARGLLHPPEVPYLDGSKMKFHDGRGGRKRKVREFKAKKLRRFKKELGVSEKLIERRNILR